MAGNLKQRLSLLRGSLPQTSASSASKPPVPTPAVTGLAPEWKDFAENCYRREAVLPDLLPSEIRHAPLQSGRNPDRNYLFFDTETTGLSGGAGTLVFLAAMGQATESGFRIAQYFLSDFSGERDFLTAVLGELRKSAVLVSYNGRAFDTQLLLNRAVVNRLPFTPPRQEDLLYTARRLWKKNIGSCSLQNVEARVLGIHRYDDIPGYEIPGLYLDFLKSKDAGSLGKVFEHNLRDVATLASLLSHMDAASLTPRIDPLLDATALGLMHLKKDPARAEAIFAGEHAANNRSASWHLGRLLKRQGRWEEAEKVWISLWRRYGDLSAALELAKYYEHKVRRYEDALSVVLSLQRKPFHTAAVAETLKKRKNRILRKIGGSSAG